MSSTAARRLPAAPPLVDDGRVLVLSWCFPPMPTGPAYVVNALLSRFDPAGVTVFAGKPERFLAHQDDLESAARVVRYDVPAWWPSDDTSLRAGPVRVPLRARAVGNVLVGIRVALDAARTLRRDDVRALLVAYPKQHFLLAGCLASLASRKPVVVYFADVYVEGLRRGRRIGRLIERYVARRAELIFAMSEPHREHIERRLRSYGVTGTPVVELPHPWEPDSESSPAETLAGSPSIVFTGAIYEAQADSIRRLIAALDLPVLADLDAHLHLLSPFDAQLVSRFGIEPGARVSLKAATRAAARAVQRAADILFMPIAFDANPHVRATASPSKMPEYLAAGRPILVHAPPDSYIARYAEEHGFAEVVTVPDERVLAEAVRRLASDEAHRLELVDRAASTLRRHDVDRVASLFRESLNRAIHGAPTRA